MLDFVVSIDLLGGLGVFDFVSLGSFSSIGINPDFLKRREIRFSCDLRGMPLWPHVILTKWP